MLPSVQGNAAAERDKIGELDMGFSKAGLRAFKYAPEPRMLSSVQWLIAQLITCGLSDKEIAPLAGVATSTVKAHNSGILKRLGLFRRAQLVRFMMESGQFDPEGADCFLAERRQKRCSQSQL